MKKEELVYFSLIVVGFIMAMPVVIQGIAGASWFPNWLSWTLFIVGLFLLCSGFSAMNQSEHERATANAKLKGKFSDEEKFSVFVLALNVANADGKISEKETAKLYSLLCHTLGIEDNDITRYGKKMNDGNIEETITKNTSSFSEEKKKITSAILMAIVGAESKKREKEKEAYKNIANALELPIFGTAKEANDYLNSL